MNTHGEVIALVRVHLTGFPDHVAHILDRIADAGLSVNVRETTTFDLCGIPCVRTDVMVQARADQISEVPR
ncbi:hypothetical protein IU453_27640 [Nocardia cyriacigeorgica]|uniref:hypothetical protein n=1 Tax=Nocardia cyriacigeorgica TaxID=135487 RepID=UPI0018932A0E|nr:hypothetical protein [Nocardia cyriacigeorgica]MBF6320522.1 hypothetical protein [Nocardia cyriacigeorgica]MBF6413234.1 hypothetical protein [Nocardia cyriacigeorgica]MBF6438007.1 hypothetical protein [Nocardia cyriacigeorgica]MBF6535009.1 hypothetical protein [Nocardia cyriacigeorgica]